MSAPLTNRQRQIGGLLAQGLTNIEIAKMLGISSHSVKFHVQRLFEKLGVSTRTEAAIAVLKQEGSDVHEDSDRIALAGKHWGIARHASGRFLIVINETFTAEQALALSRRIEAFVARHRAT